MAAISKPLMYGSMIAVAATALWATAEDSRKSTPKRAKESRPNPSKAQKAEWSFPKEALAVRFDKPARGTRDMFVPLVQNPDAITASSEEELTALPAVLADGEPNWTYTGMVEVDGKRLALLENSTLKQGGYVREGESWKKSRVLKITMANIVIAGPDGIEKTIFRFNPNQTPKPPPVPDPGFRPLDVNPALRGPIGLDIKRIDPSTLTPAPGAVKKE